MQAGLFIEIIVAWITGTMAVYLWLSGRREGLGRDRGFWLVLFGLLLLFASVLASLLDQLPGLDRMDERHRILQLVVEDGIGLLGGFVLVATGLLRWIPEIGSRRRATERMAREKERLARKVRHSSRKLSKTALDLEKEIAERERTRVALQRHEALLETVVSSIPTALFAVDERDRITLAAGRSLGILLGGTSSPSSRELEGRALSEVMPDLAEGLYGTATDTERLFRLRHGAHVFAFRQEPWRDSKGNVLGMVAIGFDTTERDRAERELDDFFALTLDLLAICDWEGRFSRVNHAFERVLGYRAGSLLGKSLASLVHPDDQERTVANLEKLQSGEPVDRWENRCRTRSGDLLWFTWSARPDLQRRVLFLAGHEISSLKEVEDQLREARDVAETANRAKTLFLAKMSHELRSPLNSVIGFSNVLLKDKEGTLVDRQRQFLDRIRANGIHLLTLINEILDLAKIESEKLELEIAEANLLPLIRETLVELESQLAEKPVELVAELPQGVQPLRCDRLKLKQILINLLANAVKFTERGQITVRLVTDEDSHEALRLSVTDTGIGIEDENLERIFEAFHQTNVGDPRSGTGLGLAISQSLCERMGYELQVASEPGSGSTFTIRFAERSSRDRERSAPTSKVSLHELLAELRPQALLVAAEKETRENWARSLGRFNLLEASTAAEGFVTQGEHRPILVLLDLGIERIDDEEAAFRFLQTRTSEDAHILVIGRLPHSLSIEMADTDLDPGADLDPAAEGEAPNPAETAKSTPDRTRKGVLVINPPAADRLPARAREEPDASDAPDPVMTSLEEATAELEKASYDRIELHLGDRLDGLRCLRAMTDLGTVREAAILLADCPAGMTILASTPTAADLRERASALVPDRVRNPVAADRALRDGVRKD